MTARTSRTWLPYSIAVVAGLAVMAAAYVFVQNRQPAVDRAACVGLEVVSSTEKDVLVRELADRYNTSDRTYAGHCARVTVHGLTSGVAMDALDQGWARQQPDIPVPQVWLPSSTLWTGQLQLRDRAAGRPEQTPGTKFPSVASSPLVIAMKQPQGELLQSKGPLGWNDILGLSGEQGWAKFGRPDWGRFTFGKDNPNLSTSGLAATIATYYAATVGKSSDLTTDDLKDPEVTRFVRQIEANVSHYSDDVVDLLRSVAANDQTTVSTGDGPGDLSAIVTQEELVYLYNEGELSPNKKKKPKVPLVALYPKEGTYNLDHPYVVFPSDSAAQKAAAADFLAYLQEPAQQAAFAAVGFRDHDQNATADLVQTVRGKDSAHLTYFSTPDPEVIQGILGSWGTLRKKANILLAVDTSGSMAKHIEKGTRLQIAAGAVANGIKLLNSQDRVGLWTFSSETSARPSQPYTSEVPLGPFAAGPVDAKLAARKPAGNTALYTTIRAAHDYLTANYDSSRINAVVVLTDGKNEYAKDNDLDRLLADVKLDPRKPVKIFCIAFDDESDLATLTKIASAASGKAFDAQNPSTIGDAFVKVVSSF
ncbi:vWA domain-containing protein [Hamadaea tsunoensis]|uniref:vWA domain-containing protein n=1 Tax=Hamadaea tsunoensis TaxID=53368 RepID=UPI000413C217|nr:extracellular solute-binding protein [Hamadaea tsunoensis]